MRRIACDENQCALELAVPRPLREVARHGDRGRGEFCRERLDRRDLLEVAVLPEVQVGTVEDRDRLAHHTTRTR